jgi:hypothetical protein
MSNEGIYEAEQLKLQKKFKALLIEALDPYRAFTGESEKAILMKDAIKFMNEHYSPGAEAAGFKLGDKPEESIGEVFWDDIYDDFSNCGGSPLHRIPELMKLWPLFSKENLEGILNKFSQTMAWHFEELE